jgi:DNA-directed RNA polymerase specialized sigma24 family protein
MHLDDVVTELVEHCGERLLRVAYQLTHDAPAAQDLVQEALLRVYQFVRHDARTARGRVAAVSAEEEQR